MYCQNITERDFWSTDPLPEFEPVGCFKDKSSDRALSHKYASFRFFIDWHNMDATIRKCALVARDIGYEYFAVQFYGECWSSRDAALTYDKYGVETNPIKCWANVGGASTNYVYRFHQVSQVTSYFLIATVQKQMSNLDRSRFGVSMCSS